MPTPDDLTPQYQAVMDHRRKGLGSNATAIKMGLSRSRVRVILKNLATRGYDVGGVSPAVPIPGMSIVKTTVQTDATGAVVNEWRRWVPDAADVEAWISELEARVAGKCPKILPPKGCDDDLLLEIPIPDHHMGMLSWAQETGNDYNCEIATEMLQGAVASILADSPKVGKAVLVVLGDYYHSDNRAGITERGGNILDTDSRYTRRLDLGIHALCNVIEQCALRAKIVEVVVISGNHDWHSAKWLSRVLGAYYSKSQNVQICNSPAPRKYIQHGNVMLAYMHGDTMKAAQFARLIPAEAKAMWAATEFRHGRVGHWHHRSTEEYPGIVVETLPTLAAPDAWANEHGYLSRRALTAFLWSAKWGLRCKSERSPQEITARLPKTTRR